MALLLVILAFLGFVVLGTGSGSTGVKDSGTATRPAPHHVNCKARMSAGESRRDCGGPPANP
jgi:hypothetical protein